MYELEINDLLLIDGGVNWGKVALGGLGVIGGVAGAAATSWTGVGAVAGGLSAVGSFGVMIRGFEDD